MNIDTVQGNWKRIKGRAQAQWGMLVGDHLGVISGRRTQFSGARQWAYGVIRSQSLRVRRVISTSDKTDMNK